MFCRSSTLMDIRRDGLGFMVWLGPGRSREEDMVST